MQKAAVSLHWLEVTRPAGTTSGEAREMLAGLGRWAEIAGLNGYPLGWRRGEVRVYGECPRGRGPRLSLTGRACEQLFGESGWDPQQLLRALTAELARCRRIDVALDDFSGLLNLDAIHECLTTGSVVSRFRDLHGVVDPKRHELRLDRGLVWGTPKSETCIRLYNKAEEQKVTGCWMRLEMQCRKRAAQRMMEALAEDGLEAACGIVRSYLEFKQAGGNRQRDRWLPQPWWTAFLGNCESAGLGVGRRGRSSHEDSWLFTQVAPALARYEQRWGAAGVEALLQHGRERAGLVGGL